MIRTTAYQERLDALSTGAEGERLAAEYLLKEGFDLLHRNWRNGRCEIDLVAPARRRPAHYRSKKPGS